MSVLWQTEPPAEGLTAFFSNLYWSQVETLKDSLKVQLRKLPGFPDVASAVATTSCDNAGSVMSEARTGP